MGELVRVPLEAAERRVQEVLPHFPEVVGAFLFGSALGLCRPDSDLDLGIVLLPGVAEPPGWDFAGLASRMEEALGRVEGHPFNVVILRPEEVIFSFRVIREGRLVYGRDREALWDFVERVARRYPDAAYRHRRALEEVLS